MSVACPARALAAKSGSAIWPRTTPDQVAVALGQRPLGLQRVLEPAYPDDGQPTARRMALG